MSFFIVQNKPEGGNLDEKFGRVLDRKYSRSNRRRIVKHKGEVSYVCGVKKIKLVL